MKKYTFKYENNFYCESYYAKSSSNIHTTLPKIDYSIIESDDNVLEFFKEEVDCFLWKTRNLLKKNLSMFYTIIFLIGFSFLYMVSYDNRYVSLLSPFANMKFLYRFFLVVFSVNILILVIVHFLSQKTIFSWEQFTEDTALSFFAFRFAFSNAENILDVLFMIIFYSVLVYLFLEIILCFVKIYKYNYSSIEINTNI